MLFGMGPLEPGAQCLQLLEPPAYLRSRDSQEAVHGVDTDLLLHHEGEDGMVQEAVFVECGRLGRLEFPRLRKRLRLFHLHIGTGEFLFFNRLVYIKGESLRKK